MSDEREFNKANENELEEVAGGRKHFYFTYCCPKCGATKKVRCDPEFGTKAPYCTKCSVMMNRYV